MSSAGTPRLAISPISWINEVLEEFGADTSAETCLSQARAAGYSGVETSRKFPDAADRLAPLLAAHDLDLASGWHSGFLAERTVEEEIAGCADHASLLQAMGCKVMVYGECGRMPREPLDIGMSNRGRLAEDDWGPYGERLTAFARRLFDDYQLQLAYHHHLMMVAQTRDEISRLMTHSGSEVGLLLDTGHACAAGFDYGLLIEDFGDRIRHVHLKDVRAEILAEVREQDLSFNDGVRRGLFTVPGDGAIDFGPVARFVADTAYGGWVVVEAEQDPQIAEPLPTVSRAFDFVTTLFAGHGVGFGGCHDG